MSISRDSVIRTIRDNQIRLLSVQYVDLGGISRAKARAADEIEDFLDNGVGFAKGNFGLTAHDTLAGDPTYTFASGEAKLVPDIETFAVPPYANRIARFIGELKNADDTYWDMCPRHAFRSLLTRVEDMGYRFAGGAEMEFSIVRREGDRVVPWISAAIQSQRGLEAGEDLLNEIAQDVEAMNLKVIKVHAEGGGSSGGHFEMDLHHQYGVKCADDVATFRDVAKAVADKRGLIATFLAKVGDEFTGSGMHLHSSLNDIKTGKNLFADPKDDRKLGLSQMCYYFIGGILEHTRGLAAAVASNVNSYKRLIFPGHWAADGVFYASGHRGAAVRIPQIAGKFESAHVEFRVPDPACNPYIAFACILAAGMDGIGRKIEPGDPLSIDVSRLSRAERASRGIKPLPKSLFEAIQEFSHDKVFESALGKSLFEEYVNIKLAEWEDYSSRVTPWETTRLIDFH